MAANVTTIIGADAIQYYLRNYTRANMVTDMPSLAFGLATDLDKPHFKNAAGTLFKVLLDATTTTDTPNGRIFHADSSGHADSTSGFLYSSNELLINSNIKITSDGAIAVYFENQEGSTIYRGYVVKISSAATDSVDLVDEGGIGMAAIVHDSSISAGSSGWFVTHGLVDVYFNSNGSTRGEYARISYSDDTVSTDNGRAESESLESIDQQRFIGYVTETRIGAGLAKCLIK